MAAEADTFDHRVALLDIRDPSEKPIIPDWVRFPYVSLDTSEPELTSSSFTGHTAT
jgi:hypothetical protein